jgi:hypothetical protein
MRLRLLILALSAIPALSSAANAAGIDRDSILTDAPAAPDKGTIRVTGGGIGQAGTETGSTNQSSVSGNILWAPLEGLSMDVGAFFQSGNSGPSARIRYQLLSQARFGIDMSAGVRFKTVGFNPNQGEVEFLLLAGRRFGNLELTLNGVFGVETGPGGGKDAEVKFFGGYHLTDNLKLGIDSRLQAEVGDEENKPVGTPTTRDFDLTTGPAISWMVMPRLQLQGLVGMFMPKGTNLTAPGGVVQASFDF